MPGWHDLLELDVTTAWLGTEGYPGKFERQGEESEGG